MVSGDVTDREDFKELADIVSVVHTSLLGVVEGIKDVGGAALRELQAVSRDFSYILILKHSHW